MKQPPNNTNTRIHHFKLVLLGDTAVGKSCLVVRFVRDEFFEFQEPTIGAAFLTQTVALDDTTIKFEIWYVYIHTSICVIRKIYIKIEISLLFPLITSYIVISIFQGYRRSGTLSIISTHVLSWCCRSYCCL